jgi:sugar O-acyltransferase (sialic acid O-acetyltransferase NeuD family)
MDDIRHAVVLWGATGQAKVISEALRGTPFKIVALFDNRPVTSPWEHIPVECGLEAFDQWLSRQANPRELYAAPAIGGANGKDRLYFLNFFVERGLRILSVRHRSAFVAEDAHIGEGCQILAQAAVCAFARLGRAVIANTASCIEHDCVVEDGAHIGPGAILAGEVRVGGNAFIGTGAVVLPRISIGENAVVGAGAVVTRDVPDGVTVIGNPARIHTKG